MNSPIQNLIIQYYELKNFLLKQNDLSQANEVSDHYRKILLLSCASYYECQITGIIQEFVNKHSTDSRVGEFLSNKALKRQYHTLFTWEASNINSFLGLFGTDFRTTISKEINENDDLKSYVKAFLTIGYERNKMVHENFLEYKLDKTFEEIVELHNNAVQLVFYLNSKFAS